MPVIPGSLAPLLSLLRPAFTAPTFETFCALVVGFVGRVSEHTVTGMWQAARLAGVVHHSRGHDFFARARWSADELGLLLLDFLVSAFVPPEGPIRLAPPRARGARLPAPQVPRPLALTRGDAKGPLANP